MEQFIFWLKIGFHHIVGIDAQDHILFLVALCAAYLWTDWKKILLLATAFTLGHSLTLVLVTLKIFSIDIDLVENWLIPLSIVITALLNMRPKANIKMWLNYLTATFFGLVHGAAFSSQLSALLTSNREEWFGTAGQSSGSIALPLFAFNVGIELGQILVLFLILLFAFVFVRILQTKPFTWTTFLSGIAFGVAISIMLSRNIG
ncbi:MAG: HupE/UreJ family protein [Raineya sp.]